ncbi:MAG: LysE family translocator [Desulfovibrionales bacterium]
MNEYVTAGILLGLTAGIAPGPLLLLVMSETLSHGFKAGLKVCFAPLITDAPIVLVTVFVLSRLAASEVLLGLISIMGAILVFWLGVQSIRFSGVPAHVEALRPRSLRKGILVNFLSPHPYLFWAGVGAPAMVRAARESIPAAAGFLIGFYLLLVGSKIIVAFLVGRSRHILSSRGYVFTMRVMGALLIALAIVLVFDGLRLLQA